MRFDLRKLALGGEGPICTQSCSCALMLDHLCRCMLLRTISEFVHNDVYFYSFDSNIGISWGFGVLGFWGFVTILVLRFVTI